MECHSSMAMTCTTQDDLNQGFLVHKVDSTTWIFRLSKMGQFFSDDKNHVSLKTVVKNKSKYTIKQYSDAVCARSQQDIIDRPSTWILLSM